MRLLWHKWPKSSQKLLVRTNGASVQWMSRAGRVLESGFSPSAGGQRLMPRRPASADILLVYLPSSHRPHITKGTPAPQPAFHPSQPLTLQVFCESLAAAAPFSLFVWTQIREDCQIRRQEVGFLPGFQAQKKIDCINILKPETAAPDLWRRVAGSQAFN